MYILAFDKGGQNPVFSTADEYVRNIGEYFDKNEIVIGGEAEKDVIGWFNETNTYPENTVKKIRRGTTLQSILSELDIYGQGKGLVSDNTTIDAYIKGAKNGEFKGINDIFNNCIYSYNRVANAFVRIVTDEKRSFVDFYDLKFEKCRLAKKGSQVWIRRSWIDFDKNDKPTKLPVYPEFKKRNVNGSELYESVLHIKNNPALYDNYGKLEYMDEALLLNEKEHRRNNWQLSQIKRGFKRDFIILSEYPMQEKDLEKYEKLTKQQGGDEKAGGIFSFSAENGKIQPLQSDFSFDFEKDDTAEQQFRLTGFPRSLVGIKSGASFSVEQIESDYEQFIPKIERTQKIITTAFDLVFFREMKQISNLSVINIPPAVIIQNYMQYMNDFQKETVIKNVFKRYGMEVNNGE